MSSENLRDKLRKDLGGGFKEMNVRQAVKVPEGGHQLIVDDVNKPWFFDILPYKVTTDNHPEGKQKGSYHYRRPYLVHKSIGFNKEWVACLKNFNKRCPICAYYEKCIERLGFSHPETKPYKPQKRSMWNVCLHDDAEGTLYWFDISHFAFDEVFEKQLKALDNDELIQTFSIPSEGYTFKLSFEEADGGGNFTFKKLFRVDAIKRPPNFYSDDVVNDTYLLDDLLIERSEKEVTDLLFSGLSEDENDSEQFVAEQQVENPPRRIVTRGAARVSEVEEKQDTSVVESAPVEEDIPVKENTPAIGLRRISRVKPEEPEEDNQCLCGHKFGEDFEKHEDCTNELKCSEEVYVKCQQAVAS